MATSDADKLFGTTEARPDRVTLQAGPLSLDLEGGTVRYVRYGGHEAIRGIDYLVRDASWRTPPAQFTVASREQMADRFLIELDGEVRQGDIHYRMRLIITGGADGRLEVKAVGEAVSDFLTNRTGFVVLHPIVGVAGRAVTVTHGGGSVSETAFPHLISPRQPIFDIRALRHEVAPGLFVTCRMEAALPHDPEAIFEMEDQRNWTDASYKTYVGSLLDPWPYRIPAGKAFGQRIVLSFEGTQGSAARATEAVAVRLGDGEAGRIPDIGLGVMPRYRAAAAAADSAVRHLRPQFITCYAEAGAEDFASAVADYARLAESLKAEVQLELVLPDGRSAGTVLAEAAEACATAGLRPARLVACPAPYLKSIQPAGPWPEVTDLAHIYNQARNAFPDAVILGGMISYFTELNRKPPPPDTIDGVTCTTAAIVHAADDRSVMETLEALPSVIASMAAMAPGKSLHLGPSAIAMRHNPYGASTAPNPERVRIPMAEDDPRQRGLLAAAWAVGYAAEAAEGGVATLALNHLAGPMGVGEDGVVHPVFHVMAALADAGGKPRLDLEVSGRSVAALGWRDGNKRRALVANLGAEPLRLRLPDGLHGRVLDAQSFDQAARDPDWSRGDPTPLSRLELAPFAVVVAGD